MKVRRRQSLAAFAAAFVLLALGFGVVSALDRGHEPAMCRSWAGVWRAGAHTRTFDLYLCYTGHRVCQGVNPPIPLTGDPLIAGREFSGATIRYICLDTEQPAGHVWRGGATLSATVDGARGLELGRQWPRGETFADPGGARRAVVRLPGRFAALEVEP